MGVVGIKKFLPNDGNRYMVVVDQGNQILDSGPVLGITKNIGMEAGDGPGQLQGAGTVLDNGGLEAGGLE
jgi:hypothetical protein